MGGFCRTAGWTSLTRYSPVCRMTMKVSCCRKRNQRTIIKNIDEDGTKRYDFQFENKRGYKTTIEGLSEKFNKGILELCKTDLRCTPLPDADRAGYQAGRFSATKTRASTLGRTIVERALKKYIQDGTEAKRKEMPELR